MDGVAGEIDTDESDATTSEENAITGKVDDKVDASADIEDTSFGAATDVDDFKKSVEASTSNEDNSTEVTEGLSVEDTAIVMDETVPHTVKMMNSKLIAVFGTSMQILEVFPILNLESTKFIYQMDFQAEIN